MKRTATTLALAILGVMTLGSWRAEAAFLWWSKFPVRTSQEARCMEFAYAVASHQGVSNIRRTQIEVAGSRGNVYVAITCVGRGAGQNAIAVVMTMSDDQASARSVNAQIQASLARMVSFD